MPRSRIKLIILGMVPFLVISYFTWRFEMGGYLNSVNVAGNEFRPDTLFNGQLAITIIERLTGPERHVNYLIDLDYGKISASPNSYVSGESLNPGGRIDDCNFRKIVEITSPNGELMADCSVESSDGKTLANHIRIRSRKSNERGREWVEEKGWSIKGIAWSADSISVAVLSQKERMDFGILGLISMTAGHPIPLETFKVTLFSVHPGHELKLPVIRRDSPSGWARLDWIQ